MNITINQYYYIIKDRNIHNIKKEISKSKERKIFEYIKLTGVDKASLKYGISKSKCYSIIKSIDPSFFKKDNRNSLIISMFCDGNSISHISKKLKISGRTCRRIIGSWRYNETF